MWINGIKAIDPIPSNIILTHICHATDVFLYHLGNIRKPMFSGGIERDQWHEMG